MRERLERVALTDVDEIHEARGAEVRSRPSDLARLEHAILYRLQLDEWAATGATIEALLGDATRSPADRLRATMRAFFQSECDEAPLRLALDAPAPSYHDAPEAAAARRKSQGIVEAFVAAAAPRASARQRSFAAELVFTTTTAVGKELSERRHDRAEINRWADAMAEMLTAYLARLHPSKPRRKLDT